jgi:hypothetical protein
MKEGMSIDDGWACRFYENRMSESTTLLQQMIAVNEPLLPSCSLLYLAERAREGNEYLLQDTECFQSSAGYTTEEYTSRAADDL